MASMKKEDAKRAVLSEYDRWAKKHPNDARMMGGFMFFQYLQDEKSDLLDFRAVGDEKWQIVHSCPRSAVDPAHTPARCRKPNLASASVGAFVFAHAPSAA